MRTFSYDNKVPGVTPEEMLWAASEEYMSGRMSVEQLEEAKRKYAPEIYQEVKKPYLLVLFEEATAKLFS